MSSFQGNQDNIYLNINTDTINRTAFQFDANRVQAVLNKPTDYQLGVVRFSVPTNSIPLMNWRPDFYKIGIEFNGVYYHTTEKKGDGYHKMKSNLKLLINCRIFIQPNIQEYYLILHQYKEYKWLK